MLGSAALADIAETLRSSRALLVQGRYRDCSGAPWAVGRLGDRGGG